MEKLKVSFELSEDQVLWFRARRGQLAGSGAASAAEAARAILGAQSQQLGPSLLALSLRTCGRPTAAALGQQLLEPPRRLVRTWGQRDTLFVYDPADWALVVAAREQWQAGGRGGPQPAERTLDAALAAMRQAGRPVSRGDLLGVVPASYQRALAEHAGTSATEAARYAAGRLIYGLAARGQLCVADKAGSEQTYATRADWLPELPWNPPGARVAALELARRYLALHGPATAHDLAHMFNARLTTARDWLAGLAGELVDVRCADRPGLVALAADAAELAAPAASGASWPLRLLPAWESLLMAHADKSWTVPREAERAQVWRKAGVVAAVVLAHGRVVATWSGDPRRGRLEVEIEPLSGWRAKSHLAPARREAESVAAHLGLDGTTVAVAG